jgi:hypothetical protein
MKGERMPTLAASLPTMRCSRFDLFQTGLITTPRSAAITHARHRKMLQVVIGEMQEHQRLFAQAGEGRTDVIGVPLAGTTRHGSVLSTRWVE